MTPRSSLHTRNSTAQGAFLAQKVQPLVVVVALTLTRIIKSVVTGQAPVTLELRNTPGKTHTHNPRWHTHISHMMQFMPPPDTSKSGILTRIIKSVVRTGSIHSGAEEYPRENTHTTRGGTRIYHISCLHQKHLKVESGVSLRCARSMPALTSTWQIHTKPSNHPAELRRATYNMHV